MIAKKSGKRETPSLAHFQGFQPQALAFFRDLTAHQTKEWMAEHKAEYEHYVREPLQSLVAGLSHALTQAEIPLRGDPKQSLFRINRDIRFSKDKSPYNTHASAALTRSGGKQAPGVLYFHLDPNGSFAAAGFFQPEPEVLHSLRLAVAEKPSAWNRIEADLTAEGYALMRDDALVRHPKGFENAPQEIESALKLKSWVVRRDIAQGETETSGLIEILTGLAETAEPLLQFGWSALDRQPARPSSRHRS